MSNRLSEVKARLAAGSTGPWEADEDTIESANGGAVCFIAQHGNIRSIERTGQHYSHADAALIAHAPADLALLVEAVERLIGLVGTDAHDVPTTQHGPCLCLRCGEIRWLRERGVISGDGAEEGGL